MTGKTPRVAIRDAAKALSKLIRSRIATFLTNRGYVVGIVLPAPEDAAHREYRIEGPLDLGDGCVTWSIVPVDGAGS